MSFFKYVKRRGITLGGTMTVPRAASTSHPWSNKKCLMVKGLDT